LTDATTLAYQKSGYQHSDSSVWLHKESEYTATSMMTSPNELSN